MTTLLLVVPRSFIVVSVVFLEYRVHTPEEDIRDGFKSREHKKNRSSHIRTVNNNRYCNRLWKTAYKITHCTSPLCVNLLSRLWSRYKTLSACFRCSVVTVDVIIRVTIHTHPRTVIHERMPTSGNIYLWWHCLSTWWAIFFFRYFIPPPYVGLKFLHSLLVVSLFSQAQPELYLLHIHPVLNVDVLKYLAPFINARIGLLPLVRISTG